MKLIKELKSAEKRMPKCILDSRQLSLKAKGLWIFLRFSGFIDGHVLDYINAKNKDKIDSIKSAVLELEKKGYLKRIGKDQAQYHWKDVNYKLTDFIQE
jgi:hypothetical protein